MLLQSVYRCCMLHLWLPELLPQHSWPSLMICVVAAVFIAVAWKSMRLLLRIKNKRKLPCLISGLRLIEVGARIVLK
ncbi:hypothetical protein AHAS_Ahas15G0133400 [Arachis hypogaea]